MGWGQTLAVGGRRRLVIMGAEEGLLRAALGSKCVGAMFELDRVRALNICREGAVEMEG